MYINPKNYCYAFKDYENNPINVFEQMDVDEYFNMLMERIESQIPQISIEEKNQELD